eukprot:1711502-Pleurochrysis_carterae.AAC.1
MRSEASLQGKRGALEGRARKQGWLRRRDRSHKLHVRRHTQGLFVSAQATNAHEQGKIVRCVIKHMLKTKHETTATPGEARCRTTKRLAAAQLDNF